MASLFAFASSLILGESVVYGNADELWEAFKDETDTDHRLVHIRNVIATYMGLSESAPFSLTSVCWMNKMLQRNTAVAEGVTPPGTLARSDRFCLYNGKLHVYASPHHIRPRLARLLRKASKTYARLRLTRKRDSIINFGAYFIRSFLAIHPFSDANGRCAAVLLARILSLCKDRPVTVYERYTIDDFVRALRSKHISKLRLMLDSCC